MAANKNDEYRDPEFEAAFGEDQTRTEMSEDDQFGLTPPVEDAAPAGGAEAAETGGGEEGGEPAAVVVVAEAPAAGGEGGEGAGDSSAAAEAKAVNDENNVAASDNKSTAESTGQAEAAAASNGAAPAAVEGSAAEEAAESPAIEAAEDAGRVPDESVPGQSGDGDVVADKKAPMTEQQLRSWEGRLRKAEADLKAKADATAAGKPEGADVQGSNTEEQTADALEQVAEETPNASLATAAENVADQVASGEMTPEEAMRTLAEDFGESFVKMIETIARSAAGGAAEKFVGEKLSKLEQETQGVIDHITSSAERAHFEKIFSAHPDFVQVSQDPQFTDFVANQGAQDVVEHGSAEAINKLLTDFKASKGGDAPADMPAAAEPAAAPVADAVDPGEADAAEGVRSAGLKLPEAPARAEDDDFATAWDKF